MKSASEYVKLTPGIEVDILATGSGSPALWERFLVMAAAGTAPDALHHPVSSVKSEWAWFIALPATIVSRMQREYIPAPLELATYRGSVVGFPTEFQTPATVYDRDFLEQAGVGKPPTPGTWDDYFGLARKLTRRSADGRTEVYGAVAESYRIMYDIRSYLNSNGQEVISPDGQPQLNSSCMVEALAKWKGHIDEGVLAFGGWPPPIAAGRGAMATWEPWLRIHLQTGRPEMYAAGRFGVSPLPHGTLGKPHVMSYGYTWSVTRTTKNAPAVWAFLEWLNMAKTDRGTTRMGDVMAELGSLPDTVADLRNQPTVREAFMKGYMDVLTGYVHVSLPDAPGAGTWTGSLNAHLASMFNGSITIMNGLEQAQTAYRNYLDAAARAAETR